MGLVSLFFNSDIPWDRLRRLLARELMAEEEAELKAWIAADPGRDHLVAELHDLWSTNQLGDWHDTFWLASRFNPRSAGQFAELCITWWGPVHRAASVRLPV